MKKLLLLLSLAACGDNIQPDCGEPPARPGYAVAFEKVNGYDRALMTLTDYQNLTLYLDRIAAWRECMEER